ncbi:MAG: hypothetical protein C0622_11540, partial [Desulfuromonas sp.]
MRITCPHCGFSKDLGDRQLPAATVKVSCPKCKETFRLQRPDDEDNALKPELAQQADAAGQTATAAPVQEQAEAPVLNKMQLHKQEELKRKVAAAALPKAGFWMRVVASLIDGAILLALQTFLGFALATAGMMSSGGGQESGLFLMSLVELFTFALSCAYYIVFTGHGGQTPGKMVLRIKVIRCDGTDISYGRAALREVPAKFLS